MTTEPSGLGRGMGGGADANTALVARTFTYAQSLNRQFENLDKKLAGIVDERTGVISKLETALETLAKKINDFTMKVPGGSTNSGRSTGSINPHSGQPDTTPNPTA